VCIRWSAPLRFSRSPEFKARPPKQAYNFGNRLPFIQLFPTLPLGSKKNQVQFQAEPDRVLRCSMSRFPGSLALVRSFPLLNGQFVSSARNVALCVLGGVAVFSVPVLAHTATTTTLAITSGGNGVTTVPMGTVVTLTATVTAGATPVSPGQVKFCDATAAHCEDIHIVGTAQLTSAGTAVVKLRPGVGSRSYNAVFLGTPNSSTARAGSASSNGALTVTAPALYPSTTVMTVTGSTGTYQLSASVSSIGTTPPTGAVSFLDTSNQNAQLGLASRGSPSSSIGFANVSNPATGTHPAVIAVAEPSAGNLIAGGHTFAEIHRRRTRLHPIGGSHHRRHRPIIVCTRPPNTLIIHPQLARSNSFRLILRWQRV